MGNFTIFLSVLILIVKFAVIILTFLKDEKCKRSIAELPANLKNILKAPEAAHYAWIFEGKWFRWIIFRVHIIFEVYIVSMGILLIKKLQMMNKASERE